MMKIKKAIILILSLVFLYSCGLQDALQGKKRSENSDEFLVEKKNPLTKPPDIDQLPVPLDQEEEKSEGVDIKKVLKIDGSENTKIINNNGDQKSLEQSVLEKIND